MDYIIIIVLLVFSALFSGLTLGFFSLNRAGLSRKAKLGNKLAKKVYSVRKNGNLLLCTLLIGNVAINSVLSIFLGSIASGVMAAITATALIVIFGEIIPQATFSRFALRLGAKFVWLVKIFIFILYPICWPIAKVLDKSLGDELGTIYSKKELMKIIEEHEDSSDSDIDREEEKIVKGALTFSDKTVIQIATPRTEIFALSVDTVLDVKILGKIFKSGHSRIPIYKNDLDTIVGILYVKDLICRGQIKMVAKLMRKKVITASEDKPLDDVFKEFKKSRRHLFIVSDEYGVTSGVITMEDVLEEIINEEIVDEDDNHVDLQKVARTKKKKLKK